MKRRSPALLAGIVLGGVLLLSHHESDRKPIPAADPAPATPVAAPPPTEKEAADNQEEVPDAPPAAPTELEPSALAKRFYLMPDGSPVPALPDDAPQQVKLGVALFRYVGAEAPPKATRSREEALKLAEKAAATAKSDFAAAVQSADRGSGENVGWISRGILEPAVEYAVFSLNKDQVSVAPIDTPRGYWVVRRVR